MVTDDILCAVQAVIDGFGSETEKNAGQAIWDMLSDFSEDSWEEMNDEQKSEWIGKYIPKTKQDKPLAYFIDAEKTELIMEHAKRPGVSICCIGDVGVTFTPLLLAEILDRLGKRDLNSIDDEIDFDQDLPEVANGNKKYYIAYRVSANILYETMKSVSDTIVPTLVISLGRSSDWKCYLKGIYEFDNNGIRPL